MEYIASKYFRDLYFDYELSTDIIIREILWIWIIHYIPVENLPNSWCI